MRESGRSREAIRPGLKNFSFSGSLELDATPKSPLTQLAMAPVPAKRRRFAIAWDKTRLRSKLMCGGLETANERDLGVEVVYGYLTEGGNSFLRVFSWDLLKMKLQDN